MRKLKEIKFYDNLIFGIIEGVTKDALRKYIPEFHLFKKGDYALAVDTCGVTILLEITADTEVKTWFDITDEEARKRGYEDAEDLRIRFNETFYKKSPIFFHTDKLAIIHFKIPEIAGNPTISMNRYNQADNSTKPQ